MIERRGARVIVVDDQVRVLLFRGGDPARPEAGSWWFTPGGGMEDGENLEDAARRELREETGLHVDDLGVARFGHYAEFEMEGRHFSQREHFFLVRVEPFVVADTEWTELERRSVYEHKWWTLDELAVTTEAVYPVGLGDIVAGLIAGE